MRKDEFPLVDKVRIQDMEYLLSRFESAAKGKDITMDTIYGIALCVSVTKEYMKRISQNGNS